MKIKNLCTVLFFLMSLTIFAQEPVTPEYAKAIGQVKFGIKGGVNFSTQNFELISNGNSSSLSTRGITNSHFGLFAEVPLSQKFLFQPELLYSVEGSDVNLFPLVFEQKFSYLRIPLLTSYRIVDRLSLQGGPQFGFLINDKINVEDDSVETLESIYKSFEFSLAFGLEYDLSESLLLGARYTAGVSDISDISDAQLRTNNFQVYIGWRLFK